jgi:hypothetical protein
MNLSDLWEKLKQQASSVSTGAQNAYQDQSKAVQDWYNNVGKIPPPQQGGLQTLMQNAQQVGQGVANTAQQGAAQAAANPYLQKLLALFGGQNGQR